MKIKNFKIIAISLILVFIFIRCEKDYDTVIENYIPDYQVKLVSPSDSIQYDQVDSLITIRIVFNSASTIQSVYCDVYASDNSKLNTSPFSLLDNGKIANGDDVANDGSFANKLPLSESYPNGIYNIKYFVTDKSNSTNQVALGTFKFDNGQTNIAPIISDDIVDPDTAIVTDTTIILTSINVFDENGLSDIDKVYFVVYRPNGTTSGAQNVLFDDGLASHGDQTSGDGIYSLIIQITSSNAKGTYRLEFQAKDHGGKLSNIINHSLLIQ
ncbi:MAG: hypothetical protein IPJ23_07485 [Ignavibacteriales bacterium]|nr:hypothetical protein [Ignavibacteriales bacterium]